MQMVIKGGGRAGVGGVATYLLLSLSTARPCSVAGSLFNHFYDWIAH